MGLALNAANASAGHRKRSLDFILRNFLVSAIFLTGIIIPVYVVVQYKSGELRDAAYVLGMWAVLFLVYWLPIGLILFRWRGHWLTRLVAGFVASLPLYFLTLVLAYPALGARFHPKSGADWGIYFSATPTFFLIVLILYFLVRGGATLSRVTRALAAAAFAASVLATIVICYRTDTYTWPDRGAQQFAIVNARLVDVSSGTIVEGQDVLISGGKITAIVSKDLDRSNWPRVDAKGGYLVPGLIDVHTHLEVPIRSLLGGFDFGYFFKSVLGDWAPQRRAYLEKGITAVRDTGDPAKHIFELRAAVNDGRLLGPRIFAVGRLVTSPHGHPVGTIWSPAITRQGAILAADDASLIAGLNQNYADGPPDAVKIIYGTIGRAPEKISAELLNRAAAWANDKKLISIVHVETADEAKDAVEAGATGIEHIAMLDSIPDSLAAEIIARKTFVDPTFGEYQTALILQQKSSAEIERALREKYAMVRKLSAAGVTITIGTDAPLTAYGEGFDDELDHFAKAGFSGAEILKFATQNNSAYLGTAGELGEIAPGYRADIFLVRQNPLESVRALRNPEWVMLGGTILFGKIEIFAGN